MAPPTHLASGAPAPDRTVTSSGSEQRRSTPIPVDGVDKPAWGVVQSVKDDVGDAVYALVAGGPLRFGGLGWCRESRAGATRLRITRGVVRDLHASRQRGLRRSRTAPCELRSAATRPTSTQSAGSRAHRARGALGAPFPAVIQGLQRQSGILLPAVSRAVVQAVGALAPARGAPPARPSV